MNNNKCDEITRPFPAPTIIGNSGSVVSSKSFSSNNSWKSSESPGIPSLFFQIHEEEIES